MRDALSAGRGVFRNFKNALKQSRDLERSWYRFKEREMRRVVAEWYNQEREAAGLERLGPEPEETEDLTVSDFVVDAALPHQLAGAGYVDREAMLELGQVSASELGTRMKQRLRAWTHRGRMWWWRGHRKMRWWGWRGRASANRHLRVSRARAVTSGS